MPAPKATRSRLPRSLLVMVALVVLADVGLGLAAHVLPPVDDWNYWEATNKVAAMRTLSERGGADVVVVGSSIMNAAVDPAVMTRLLGFKRPTFDAALSGASLVAADFWTLRVVVPLLHPRIVVIGVTSREFNDAVSEPVQFERRVLGSPGARRVAPDRSLKDRLYGWADDLFALVRYRSVLRDPGEARRQSQGPFVAVDALGAFRRTSHKGYAILPDFLHRVVPQSIVPYAIRGRQERGLRHLLRALTGIGVVPVLVKMPVATDLIPLHQHGAVDYRAFEAELARFVSARPGLRFLDMTPLFPSTSDFRDPLHLNDRGRARFSRALADRLRTI